jgi:imidazolonepropionase-like amidohydrolase
MERTQFIVAGKFIDGSGTDVRRNIFLAVKDTIITAIGSATDLPCTNSTAIDDFSHYTILPALIDCSVSLTQSPSVDKRMQLSSDKSDLSEKAALLERHSNYCHTHGVQGVVDSSESTGLVESYQTRMVQGSRIDIRRAGNSADSEILKITYSTNIEDEKRTTPQLTREDLHHILRHRGEKKAVVIANGQQQVKEALEAGCDAIEQGYAMGEDNLRRMAENDILWIPSVLRARNSLDGASAGGDVCCRFSQRYVAPGKAIPGAEAFWKKILAEQLAQLHFARELGVTTAMGTGAGSVGILHGESMAEEIKLFIKAGYSLEESIRCASENGARFFDMEKLGMLTVGRKATFLIASQLPRKLSYLEGIYIDGEPSTTYHKNPIKAVSQERFTPSANDCPQRPSQ